MMRISATAMLGDPPDRSVSQMQAIQHDEQRLAFKSAIDAIRRDVEAQLGERDVAHIRRVVRFSRGMQWLGRGLIHLSFEPLGFGLGVFALWIHKTLELMEIGHTVLHGTYDQLPGAEEYHSETFRWKAPIDEHSWRLAHNVRHHQYTNIAGRDPDLNFGGLRLSALIPYRFIHKLQPFSNLLTWSAFSSAINVHATGLIDVYFRASGPGNLPDRKLHTILRSHAKALRKFAWYYGREYIFFPVLAGPFFPKVLIGNMLSEFGRDVYAGAIIYCGHVGASDYPSETRATGRASFYVMQVEGTRDVQLSTALSILCGALNHQIEHHLFPRLPPNRLREIAPRVRAACEAHGVTYRSDTWPRTLVHVLRSLRALAAPQTAPKA